MKRPEMILFDYGHTLLYQPGHNASNGSKALFPYISENPHNISFEEFDKTIADIWAKLKPEKGSIREVHEYAFLKLALEYMDLSLSISFEEAEKVIMNGISKGGIMPYADKMLAYLNAEGIRTGVISNICFSGKALQAHFDDLIPDNQFAFVLASSDYVFRKPDPTMFEIALRKAGLTADKVWYCGDSIEKDIYGAKNAGIFPVLYEGETPDESNPFSMRNAELQIDFDHLHIHDWRELIAVLERLKHGIF